MNKWNDHPVVFSTKNIPGPPGPPPPAAAVERRHALEDLLWVEAPELLGADAVPEDAGEPQRHADLHSPEDYVVGVAGRQVDPEKMGRKNGFRRWSNRILYRKGIYFIYQYEVFLDSLGLPELLERLREHESDCDHHHDGLGEEADAALVQLTSVHRRTPELQVLLLLLAPHPLLVKKYF